MTTTHNLRIIPPSALVQRLAMRTYFVYILTNPSRVLYVGVTNDIQRRVWEHKQGRIPGFTARYGLKQLVYLEPFADARAAIAREKQIKGWLRIRKTKLISSANPSWKDLSDGWFPSP